MNLCSEEGVHEEEQLLQLWTDHLLRHLKMVSRWVTIVKVGKFNDDLLLGERFKKVQPQRGFDYDHE